MDFTTCFWRMLNNVMQSNDTPFRYKAFVSMKVIFNTLVCVIPVNKQKIHGITTE